MEPRYLIFVDKVYFFPFERARSSGKIWSMTSSLACFREEGKNMASDLDLEVSDPICIMSPKRAKWAFKSSVAWWSSCLVWKQKKLSST